MVIGCAIQYGKQTLVGHCDISVTSLWYHCADCRALTGCSQEKCAGVGGQVHSKKVPEYIVGIKRSLQALKLRKFKTVPNQ